MKKEKTAENQGEVAVKKKKGKGCVIAFFIIIVAFIVLCVVLTLTFDDKNTSKTKEEKVAVVFDALKYRPENNKNITEAELVKSLGKPQSTDEWNYKTAYGVSYPIRTLVYGNIEYDFNNDNLQRITIFDEFTYNNKQDFLPMFNLKKYSNTKIEDTNVSYRAYNCGVHDIWIIYEDGKITTTKITYGSLFDQ